MYRYFLTSIMIALLGTFSIQGFAADNPSPVAAPVPTTNPSPVAAPAPADNPSPAANPSPLGANKDASTLETIKVSCVKEWVKLGADTSDKDAYKAFGEKYCTCASKEPLNNDDDIKKAARLCMTRTLLIDTMDGLEASPGLANLDADKIEKACQDKLGIIYPKMDAEGKKVTFAYCKCASPKLADISKNEGSFNDQQWEDKIYEIAGSCAGTKP